MAELDSSLKLKQHIERMKDERKSSKPKEEET